MVAINSHSSLLERIKTDTGLPWVVVTIDNEPAFKTPLKSGGSLVLFPILEQGKEDEFVLVVYNKIGVETNREYCDEYIWLTEILETAPFL